VHGRGKDRKGKKPLATKGGEEAERKLAKKVKRGKRTHRMDDPRG
jgi:hypothetical protein